MLSITAKLFLLAASRQQRTSCCGLFPAIGYRRPADQLANPLSALDTGQTHKNSGCGGGTKRVKDGGGGQCFWPGPATFGGLNIVLGGFFFLASWLAQPGPQLGPAPEKAQTPWRTLRVCRQCKHAISRPTQGVKVRNTRNKQGERRGGTVRIPKGERKVARSRK